MVNDIFDPADIETIAGIYDYKSARYPDRFFGVIDTVIVADDRSANLQSLSDALVDALDPILAMSNDHTDLCERTFPLYFCDDPLDDLVKRHHEPLFERGMLSQEQAYACRKIQEACRCELFGSGPVLVVVPSSYVTPAWCNALRPPRYDKTSVLKGVGFILINPPENEETSVSTQVRKAESVKGELLTFIKSKGYQGTGTEGPPQTHVDHPEKSYL